MSAKKSVKRVDSNRTVEAKKRAILRRVVRSSYAQNGGRFQGGLCLSINTHYISIYMYMFICILFIRALGILFLDTTGYIGFWVSSFGAFDFMGEYGQ